MFANYLKNLKKISWPKRREIDLSQCERIYLELSNVCNYSNIHKSCPLHRVTEIHHLPLEIITKVLLEAKQLNFRGEFRFHNYNEPTIDPRLFLILYKVREIFSDDVTMCMRTNKSILSPELKKEIEAQATLMTTDYESGNAVFDDRCKIYQNTEISDKGGPCKSPLGFLWIDYDGQVGLCCYDPYKKVKFGNLSTKTLKEIINDPKIREIYENLNKGIRILDVCKRCKTHKKN
ncbi:SPASM domain-containing protein [Thermodesulfobacteriota bacterium]